MKKADIAPRARRGKTRVGVSEKMPETTNGPRDAMRLWIVLGFLVGLTISVPHNDAVSAESAIELLSGFDSARIQACYPVKETRTAGEMAKLLFRLRKSKAGTIASLGATPYSPGTSASKPVAGNQDALVTGDVISITGTVSVIRQYKVPENLIEFLDLDVFQEVVVTADKANDQPAKTFSIFAPPILGKVAKGDQITAAAMVVRKQDEALVFAAGRIAWFPMSAKRVGWKLLSENGVDLSRLAESGTRSRQTLKSEDSDAFYSMLGAAGKINALDAANASSVPAPKNVQPLDILRDPVSHRAQWIRLRLSTVRVTRIDVSNPTRQQQLGQDHYFQIDASGDLGTTVVELARQEGESGDPIRISGVYPISLVSVDLPQKLKRQMKREKSAVMMTSEPVVIDGFFYRLWSYTNEFMTREGGGKQVGPLIVVSRWQTVTPQNEPVGGIAYLGYGLAAAVVLSIAATVWWSRKNSRDDEQAKASRKSDTIDDSISIQN